MPPAARKFHIQVERRLCSAISPRLARNTRGRLPVLATIRVARHRAAPRTARPSRCGVSGRTVRLAGEPAPAAACGVDLHAVVAEKREHRDAGQLQAARGDRLGARFARRARCRPASAPETSAATMPPLASMSWNSAQAFCASSSVSFSTYQEPPIGIGDAAERGFLLQHELGVARDAPREAVGHAERPGEGQHGDGVGAAECGARRRRPSCAACWSTDRAWPSCAPSVTAVMCIAGGRARRRPRRCAR